MSWHHATQPFGYLRSLVPPSRFSALPHLSFGLAWLLRPNPQRLPSRFYCGSLQLTWLTGERPLTKWELEPAATR